MKVKLIIILTLLICFLYSNKNSAQENIKVKYTETVFFDNSVNLPPQAMANMPKSRDNKKILFANDSSSIYVVNKEDVEPQETSSGDGRQWRSRRPRVEAIVYNNINNNIQTTFTDLFGKEFLIEEESVSKWKLHSGEQRDILGHTCVKATQMKDTTLVTAWFASDLQYSIGPDGYNGLPGLILALSVGESKVLLATSIEENVKLTTAVEKPTKGDKVTRAEYEKLRKQKMEEMKEMWGGQGGNQRMFRN